MEFQINRAEVSNITGEKTGLIPISLKVIDSLSPVIEVSPRGKLKFITGSIAVSSTGSKTIIITVPSGKRWIPIATNVYSDGGGTWTTNAGSIRLVNSSITFTLSSNTDNVNSVVSIFSFPREINLNPGDSIKMYETVNAYTSAGTIYLDICCLEFDLI